MLGIRSKLLLGVMGCSYSYGFYRSWSLPVWEEKGDLPIRLGMSNVMGVIYVFPPFALIKYAELGMRIYDVYDGTYVYDEKEKRYRDVRGGYGYMTNNSHWKEWGFYHPKML